MALVSVIGAGEGLSELDTAAARVCPDETAFDVLRAVRSCHGTGLTCIDAHLDGGCLGPSELVVLHGESGSAKSALLRNVLASYVAAAELGGHALPAVLIDTEGTFDVLLLADVLTAAAERKRAETSACGKASELAGIQTAELIREALSRLLVLRPAEPADLLRQLCQIREVLIANPTTSLLVVDSMSAWQPIATAFPRAVAPLLREAWKALGRLQHEHCLAVVVAHREDANGFGSTSGFGGSTSATTGLTPSCHLSVMRRVAESGETSFATSRRFSATAMPGGDSRGQEMRFLLSEAGEVISVA